MGSRLTPAATLFLTLSLLLASSLDSGLALPQVDQEIDDPNDLLAVESARHEEFSNSVDPFLSAIAPAPPGFGGERLTAGAPEAVVDYENVINPDGSYSFR